MGGMISAALINRLRIRTFTEDTRGERGTLPINKLRAISIECFCGMIGGREGLAIASGSSEQRNPQKQSARKAVSPDPRAAACFMAFLDIDFGRLRCTLETVSISQWFWSRLDMPCGHWCIIDHGSGASEPPC